MLNSLRKTASTGPIKLLLLLIVASFAMWGVGDMFRAGQADVAVSVGDASISNARIEQAYKARLAAVQQQNDGEIPDFFKGIIQQGVVQQMVQQSQLEQFMRHHHIIVDNASVARELKANDIFHVDGAFSAERFKQIMQMSGLRQSDYEESLREQMAMDALQNAWVASVPNVEQQAKLKYMLDEAGVSIEALHVPLSLVNKIPEPTGDELAEFYEGSKEQFAAPEYRSFDLLSLSRDELIEDVSVGDDVLQAYYADNSDQFMAPPRLDVEQLLLSDADVATDAADALRDGATLEQLRAEYETLPEAWQLLEDVTQDVLPEQAYRLMASASNDGDVVGPYESSFGQHIFRLKAVKDAGVKPFAEVKGRIKDMVQRDMQDEALHQTMTSFEDKLAAGESLTSAAKSMGWNVVRVGAVNQQGEALDGRASDALDEDVRDAVLSELYQLDMGHNVGLKHWPDGTVTAISLVEVIESRERALDEVRGSVTKQWREYKSLSMLQERADAMVASVEQGDSLKKIAKDTGMDAPQSFKLTRKETSHDVLPPLCVRLAFLTDEGEVSESCDDGEGGAWILKVVQTHMADEPTEEELATVKLAIEKDMKEEMLQLFFGYLGTLYPVSFSDAPADNGNAG